MKKTFTFLLLFTAASSYAQKTKIELNLQKDSTYTISVATKMNIDQLIQGTHQIVKTEITGITSHKIISIQDTTYTMDVTYNSIVMKMNLGDKTMSLNSSDADTTNIMSNIMRNMIGRPFTIIMSRRGQIVAIKNTDNLFKDIFKGFPQINEQRKAQALAQAQQSFGEKAIKGSFQESFVIFPKASVTVKSIWTNQLAMEAAAISIKTNTTFTLDAITDNAFEISGSSVVVPDKAAAFKASSQFFIRLINVSGTTTLKLKIDKKTGWVIQSQISKHIKGDVELKKSLAEPVMITYPMVIDANLNSIGN